MRGRGVYYGGGEDGYTSYPDVDGTFGDVGGYELVEQSDVHRSNGGAASKL